MFGISLAITIQPADIASNSTLGFPSKIDEHFLIDTFVTEFDQNYKVIRNIRSDKIDIKNNQWTIFDPQIFNKNVLEKKNSLTIYSNFNYERINSLFSNLASLSFLQLLELKNNYDLLNYSTVDIKIQIQKIISYPVYLIIMTLFSSILMLNSKRFKNNYFKISIGLFACVIIYYLNNLFNVMGATEKINYVFSVWLPLVILMFLLTSLMFKINEK